MPRERPLGLSPLFERSADEGEQGDLTSLLDCGGYDTLVTCACTRLATRADLAIFGDVAAEQVRLFIVNCQGFICTELAEFGLRKEAAISAAFFGPLLWSSIIRHCYSNLVHI